MLLQYFLDTAVPAAPLNVTVNQVERVSGGGSVTITASWIRPPNYELFDIDHYDINVSSTSGIQHMAITVNGSSTSTVITVTENLGDVRLSTTFTITILPGTGVGRIVLLLLHPIPSVSFGTFDK